MKVSNPFLKSLFFSVLFLTISCHGLSNNKTTSAPPPQQSQREQLVCEYILPLEQMFFKNHVFYSQVDDKMRARVVEQYIKHLDSSKMYLLKSDVDQIKGLLTNFQEKLAKKDCVFLTEIQKIVVNRTKERAEFAKSVLDKKYKLDKTAEIQFDADKKDYPVDKKAAEDYIRKFVHFQIANYLVADTKLEEAKTNVKKNWDRTIKRVNEEKTDDIYANFLDAIARSLDPHSDFMAIDNFDDFNINMSLSLEGIGANLSQQDGFTIVEALVPGGAAARSGLVKPQDKILAVGQGESGKMSNVVEEELRDVVKQIRGPKGTKVRLMILRKEGDKKNKVEITLTRDKVKLEDQAASIIYQDQDVNGVKKKIGVINFPSFYSDGRRGGRSSAADMKKLVTEAREKKVDGLLLDLSENGGGSLDDAVKIAGLFFKTGNVVKQSLKDNFEKARLLEDTDSKVDWNGPLVVLTSRASASASEIVSGAMKDYQRAVIVGNDHTFGKGTVQQVMDLPIGGLKVTVGMFFTPGGNSTQHRGVDSDVVIPGPLVTDEVGEKTLDYSLAPAKIDSFLSKDAYVSEGADAWLKIDGKVINLLKEKSQARVDKNEEFKKIVEDLNKAKAKGRLIKISELLNDKESKDKKEKAKALKNASREQKDQEYLKRVDIKEATNVLLDLIQVQSPMMKTSQK